MITWHKYPESKPSGEYEEYIAVTNDGYSLRVKYINGCFNSGGYDISDVMWWTELNMPRRAI